MEEEGPQFGAVAVALSLARDKRLLCLQREFPFNTTPSLLAEGLALMFQSWG